MTAFLILVASIAVGVLLCRYFRTRGVGKALRRTGGVAFGFIVLMILTALFNPLAEAPTGDGVATAQPIASATTPAAIATNPSMSTVPRYTAVNAESAQAARAYVANLDMEIKHSIAALPGISMKSVSGYSHRFANLATDGERDFGADVRQLGYCGMAGHAAHALWEARIVGSRMNASALQRVQQATDHYQEVRGWCLDRLKR